MEALEIIGGIVLVASVVNVLWEYAELLRARSETEKARVKYKAL